MNCLKDIVTEPRGYDNREFIKITLHPGDKGQGQFAYLAGKGFSRISALLFAVMKGADAVEDTGSHESLDASRLQEDEAVDSAPWLGIWVQLQQFYEAIIVPRLRGSRLGQGFKARRCHESGDLGRVPTHGVLCRHCHVSHGSAGLGIILVFLRFLCRPLYRKVLALAVFRQGFAA